MRFSDEIQFEYDLEGKLHFISKPSKRYYSNCIQEDKKLNKKDKKYYHCWAMIGYNFKLEIFFIKC